MSAAATRWCWKHGKQVLHLFSMFSKMILSIWKTGATPVFHIEYIDE
jgi:hypothetical protein